MASRGGDERDTAFGTSEATKVGRHPTEERDPELEDVTPGFVATAADREPGDHGDHDERFPRVTAEKDVPQRPLAERFGPRR